MCPFAFGFTEEMTHSEEETGATLTGGGSSRSFSTVHGTTVRPGGITSPSSSDANHNLSKPLPPAARSTTTTTTTFSSSSSPRSPSSPSRLQLLMKGDAVRPDFLLVQQQPQCRSPSDVSVQRQQQHQHPETEGAATEPEGDLVEEEEEEVEEDEEEEDRDDSSLETDLYPLHRRRIKSVQIQSISTLNHNKYQ